jgi:hypothetical protein
MSVHHSGRIGGPHELAGHPQLEPEVKRAILAAWASDRYAVPSRPALRKPPELSEPVPVREVLDALKSLDGHLPPIDGT